MAKPYIRFKKLVNTEFHEMDMPPYLEMDFPVFIGMCRQSIGFDNDDQFYEKKSSYFFRSLLVVKGQKTSFKMAPRSHGFYRISVVNTVELNTMAHI